MDWGTFGQGAAAGAGVGSAFGPWGAGIGALGGGLASMFGGGDKTTPGQTGATFLQTPQMDYYQGNMDYLSNYYNQGLSNIQAGKAPQWYQQYEAANKPKQRQDLYQQYYGGNWGPGTLDTLQSMGASAGTPVGKRGTAAGKMLSDYNTQSQAIDQFFNTGAANAMQSEEGTYLQGMRNLPSTVPGQWQTWQTQPQYQQGAGSKIAGSLAAIAPYAKQMFPGMQNWNPFASNTSWNTSMDYSLPSDNPAYQTQGGMPIQSGGQAPITQQPNWSSPQTVGQMAFPFGNEMFNSGGGLAQPGYQPGSPWAPYSSPGTMGYSGGDGPAMSTPASMYGTQNPLAGSFGYQLGKGMGGGDWSNTDPVGNFIQTLASKGINFADWLASDPVGNSTFVKGLTGGR